MLIMWPPSIHPSIRPKIMYLQDPSSQRPDIVFPYLCCTRECVNYFKRALRQQTHKQFNFDEFLCLFISFFFGFSFWLGAPRLFHWISIELYISKFFCRLKGWRAPLNLILSTGGHFSKMFSLTFKPIYKFGTYILPLIFLNIFFRS